MPTLICKADAKALTLNPMNEQLLSKYAERKAKRIMDKQNDSLFKSKLVKSINLKVLYDDGMGIFKDTK
jgi:hypothetical protein